LRIAFTCSAKSCYYTIINRAAVIEQLRAIQQTLSRLLTLLESSEADKFVAHLYQARKQYRLVCERPNQGNKAIEAPDDRKLPSRAEPRLQRRFPRLGALAAAS
jgi:hypothetical protein